MSEYRVCAYALCLAFLFGCSSSSSNEPLSGLEWTTCDGNALQCAELEVPVNYSDPGGEKILLSLIRHPSLEPSQTESILINPGGPGGSGVEGLPRLIEASTVPGRILRRYNLVSFDPRGVGESAAVVCEGLRPAGPAEFPISTASIAASLERRANAATQCSEKYGDYLQYLGSINVVRDMDEIRKALGQETLNFIGYSYGTRLAALYMQTYPESSGRIVLDASVLPDSSLSGFVKDLLPLFQSRIRSILAECGNYDVACDADRLIGVLADRHAALRLDQSPESRFEVELLLAILEFSVEDPTFANLSSAPLYDYLIAPDVTVLTDFAVELDGIGYDIFDEIESDTGGLSVTAPYAAVLCADDGFRPTPESVSQALGEYDQILELLRLESISVFETCAGWPEALEPLAPLASDRAPTPIVIGGIFDARTPLVWSEVMATAIGGKLITSGHFGHTATFLGRSSCVDDIVETFFENRLLPERSECFLDN